MAKENYRDRKFMFMLYPDNPQHVEAFEKIKKNYDYAAILHDKDYWTEEDEKKNPEHVAGFLKKAHWHIVVRLTTKHQRWATAVCDEIGLHNEAGKPSIQFVDDPIGNIDNALLYLIHYNDEEKFQYDESEVFGPLKTLMKEAMNKGQKSEGEKVKELIHYIKEQDGYITVTDFALFCAENGYWAEFRRSGAIICKILDEHNNRYCKNIDKNEKM